MTGEWKSPRWLSLSEEAALRGDWLSVRWDTPKGAQRARSSMATDARPKDRVNDPVVAWVREKLPGNPDLTSNGGMPNLSRLAEQCRIDRGLQSKDSIRQILRREYKEGRWPR